MASKGTSCGTAKSARHRSDTIGSNRHTEEKVTRLLKELEPVCLSLMIKSGVDQNSWDDYFQAARIGALKAIRTYRRGHGASLVTWAWWAIRKSIQKEIKAKGRHMERLDAAPEQSDERTAVNDIEDDEERSMMAAELSALSGKFTRREILVLLAWFVDGKRKKSLKRMHPHPMSVVARAERHFARMAGRTRLVGAAASDRSLGLHLPPKGPPFLPSDILCSEETWIRKIKEANT